MRSCGEEGLGSVFKGGLHCSEQSPTKAKGVCINATVVEGPLRKGNGRGREVPLGGPC